MEPTWFYDLDGGVRFLLEQDGDVPLMLCNYLRTFGRANYADLPEVEFTDVKEEKKIAEIDLIAIVDKQLIVSETKRSATLGNGKLARQVAAKRVRIAQVLRADQVLFATSAPKWEDHSIQSMIAAMSTSWNRIYPPVLRVIENLGGTVTDSRIGLDGSRSKYS
jgi:hypothetical protein